ncbi:DUF6232 family protein [Leptolyngbya iicbica]|nr:DUF6232 family protein [Leptolyngbya sp. LK]
MEIFSEEEVNLNLGKTNEIIVHKNAVVFRDTVYQISNISYATVKKWKRAEDKSMPLYVLWMWIFLSAFVIASSEDPRVNLYGVLILIVGVYFYFVSKLEKVDYFYLLILDFNSGSRRFFKSCKPDFLESVVLLLKEAIEDPYFMSRVVDFSDNSIKIYGDAVSNDFRTGLSKWPYDLNR